MSRSLTATFMGALLAGQTDEIYHTLVEISHSDMTTKRYVNNYEDVVSNGNTYTAAAFDVHLPHDVEDQLPMVTIRIDNVDRIIMTDVRSVSGAPDIDVSIVLQSDPDTVEVGPFSFKIRSVDYDKLQIAASLQYEDILNESFPDQAYTPQLYPGLFP